MELERTQRMDPERPNPSAPRVYRPVQTSAPPKAAAPPVYRPGRTSSQMKPGAPPVYRPNKVSQMKPAAPAVYRPGQTSPQLKAAAPSCRLGSLAPLISKFRPLVVQRMQRDKWDVDEPLWPISLPQQPGSEEYKVHVRARHRSFLYVVLSGVAMAQKHGVQISQTLFSDTAEGQLCTGGNNFTGGSFHAAHLCRPTLNLSSFPSHLTTVGSDVHDLYLASINTTNQRRADNLGPDKIIDRHQTAAKQWLLSHIPHQIDKTFFETFVQSYLQGLVAELSQFQHNADSFSAAWEATNELLRGYQSLASDLFEDIYR